jgi:hypothetical protein
MKGLATRLLYAVVIFVVAVLIILILLSGVLGFNIMEVFPTEVR